jgi:hypothetical protein
MSYGEVEGRLQFTFAQLTFSARTSSRVRIGGDRKERSVAPRWPHLPETRLGEVYPKLRVAAKVPSEDFQTAVVTMFARTWRGSARRSLARS